MKKILLSVSTLVLALTANAQNSNAHAENMDGVTPCFLSYEGGPGAFQGAAGHDFKNMQWDQANNVMTFDATTHATLHGPLYYTLKLTAPAAAKVYKIVLNRTTSTKGSWITLGFVDYQP